METLNAYMDNGISERKMNVDYFEKKTKKHIYLDYNLFLDLE